MGPGTLSCARTAARTLLRLPALAVAVGALVLAGVTTTLAASARSRPHARHSHASHALTQASVRKLIAAYLAAHPAKAGARGVAGPQGPAGAQGPAGP